MSQKEEKPDQVESNSEANQPVTDKDEEERLLASSDQEMEMEEETNAPESFVTKLEPMLTKISDRGPGYFAKIFPIEGAPDYAITFDSNGNRVLAYNLFEVPEACMPVGKELEVVLSAVDSFPAHVGAYERELSALVPIKPAQKEASTQIGRSYADVAASKSTSDKGAATPKPVSGKGAATSGPTSGKGVDAGKGKLPLKKQKPTKVQGIPDPIKLVPASKRGFDPAQPSTSKASAAPPASQNEKDTRQIVLELAEKFSSLEQKVENEIKQAKKRTRSLSTGQAKAERRRSPSPKKKKDGKGKKQRNAKASLERESSHQVQESKKRKSREASKAEKAKPAIASLSAAPTPAKKLPSMLAKDKAFLFAESMHGRACMPRDRCSICGEKSHLKDKCPNVGKVECLYFYCRNIDHNAHTHDLSVCPMLVRICDVCRVRGHEPGPACSSGRKHLRSLFEGRADYHVYAQFRREIFSWGYIYIGSEKAARNLAKKFTYEEFSQLDDAEARWEIALASK